MNYNEYMSLSNNEKFELFMNTLFPTNRTPSYWVNWNNVRNNIKVHELNLNTLNFLVGKENIKEEARALFLSQPQLLNTVPILLAAREEEFKVLSFENAQMVANNLDFKNPDIKAIDKYINFMEESGLLEFLANDLNKSLVDYVFGVQAGLDTNARKNRSGSQNETILERNLKNLVQRNSNLEFTTQATAKYIKDNWNMTIPEAKDKKAKGGRRYDGAVYNKQTGKVTLIETNFYGSKGSKLKSVSGEFSNLYNFLKNEAPNDINFVWISDGPGWETARNPMQEAFEIIPNIINLKMVRDGYLDEIVKK